MSFSTAFFKRLQGQTAINKAEATMPPRNNALPNTKSLLTMRCRFNFATDFKFKTKKDILIVFVNDNDWTDANYPYFKNVTYRKICFNFTQPFLQIANFCNFPRFISFYNFVFNYWHNFGHLFFKKKSDDLKWDFF